MDAGRDRIGDVEQRVTRLEAQMEDLANDMRAIAPLGVTVAEMKVVMGRLEVDMAAILAGQKEVLSDSRSWRRALILGSFTVLAAVVSSAAVIVAAVL